MAEPIALSPEQLRTLDRLKELLEPDRYYLAGGTAVAYYLGHRRSRDLDIFSTAPVDIEQLGHKLTAGVANVEVLGSTDAVLQLYFDDAEAETVPLEGMTDALWKQVRSYFEIEAPDALRRRTTTP